MLKNLTIFKYNKHPVLQKTLKKGTCSVCGYAGEYVFQKVIDDNLANSWEISNKQRNDFDNRESLKCQKCGASLRIRRLAKAIVQVENQNCKNIKDLVETKTFQSKKIAEINNCGAIHEYLKELPNLYYSEYNPVFIKHTAHEDLQNLSYKKDYFDLVLTSDTLEHIPDTKLALREIRRILKPGGYHIFTVPILQERKATKQRAKIVNGKISYLEPKSYHGQNTDDYLVFYEFGRDLPKIISRQGFKVMLYYCNIIYNEHSFVFVTRKES